MEITNVQVKLRNDGKLKGFANLTFDECFVVRGCKIIQGNNGYFVSMPSQKKDDGSFRDIAHPINPTMRQRIEDSVIKAYVTELRAHDSVQPGGNDLPSATQAIGSEYQAQTQTSSQAAQGTDNTGSEQS